MICDIFYSMFYMCTSTAHDQLGDMYLGIFKDPLNRKYKIFKNKQYS